MKTIYLILQADYENISLGIWNGTTQIAMQQVNKLNACQLLMPSLLELLNNNAIAFEDLSFIAVNQGPAPFTTLRIVITTANGLNFAHKLPLIGIDALQTFAQEYKSTQKKTVILLNAFAQDAYFATVDGEKIESGCENNTVLLERLAQAFPTQDVTFIGNGAELFKETINKYFSGRAQFKTPNPHYTNFQETALTAYDFWTSKQNISETLLPLYLKIQTYKIST